jgi:hypothetical protein
LTLTVTQRVARGDAFLLVHVENGQRRMLLYDRSAQVLTQFDEPGRLVGRASWERFDGDPTPIVREVRRLLSMEDV